MMSEFDESNPTVETKFGKCKVGPFLSNQATFTESNFKATADIDIVPRLLVANKPEELKYPHFPLQHTSDSGMVVPFNLTEKEITLVNELKLDEDEINNIECETRKQSDCEAGR